MCSVAILTYHHIGEVPPEQADHRGLHVPPERFRQQLAWLKERGYISVSLDDVASAINGGPALPKRWVVLTFDDGWRDNYTNGFPVLQEMEFGAYIFVITDRVARKEPVGRWDDYLTLAEIHEMRDAGIAFGSHTHTHPRLTKLESGSLEIGDEDMGSLEENTVLYELMESRRRMEEDLDLDAKWFCYPYGNFSPRIAALVKEAGYAGALSTIRDNRPKAGQLYWLPRVMVMNDTKPERLGYMLSRWYHWVHSWKNRKRWKSIR